MKRRTIKTKTGGKEFEMTIVEDKVGTMILSSSIPEHTPDQEKILQTHDLENIEDSEGLPTGRYKIADNVKKRFADEQKKVKDKRAEDKN